MVKSRIRDGKKSDPGSGIEKIRIRDPEQKSRIRNKTASAQVRNLVESLLRLDPEERLGSGDVTRHGAYLSIKRHPFFAGLDFETLHQTPPPFTLETCGDSPAGTVAGTEKTMSS